MSDNKSYAQSLEAVQVFKQSLEQISSTMEQIGLAMMALQEKLNDTKIVEQTNFITKKLEEIKIDTYRLTELMPKEQIDTLSNTADKVNQATSFLEGIKKVFSTNTFELQKIHDAIEKVITVFHRQENLLEQLKIMKKRIQEEQDAIDSLTKQEKNMVKSFGILMTMEKEMCQFKDIQIQMETMKERLQSYQDESGELCQEVTTLVEKQIYQKEKIAQISRHIEQQHMLTQAKIEHALVQVQDQQTEEICQKFQKILEGQGYAQQVAIIQNILNSERVLEEHSGVSKLFKNSYEERYRELRRIVEAIRSVIERHP